MLPQLLPLPQARVSLPSAQAARYACVKLVSHKSAQSAPNSAPSYCKLAGDKQAYNIGVARIADAG